MTTIQASAPGKVILCGEYAVLDGAPAISMAVNRRAEVTATEDGDSRIRMIGPDRNADASLFHCVIDAAGFKPFEDYSFTLDTSAFVDGGSNVKLGIGSSAALTVALGKALVTLENSNDDVADIAVKAHRNFQKGTGSGVDIATSIAGGLIEYQMQGNQFTSFRGPAGLVFALFWSGVAASTRERVERLTSSVAKPSRSQLAEVAASTALAWQSGDADAVIRASEQYVHALKSFSVDHGLGIFEAGHDVLVDDALTNGFVYKPCGAGGGDVGIALALDSATLDAFAKRAELVGFRRLDIGIDKIGVQIRRDID